MRRILTFFLSLALVFSLAAIPARAETGDFPTVPAVPVTEPTGEATTEPETVPETEPETEPTTVSTAEPETEPATEAETEALTEPETEAATEPFADVQSQVGELLVTVHDAPAGAVLAVQELSVPSFLSDESSVVTLLDRSFDLKLYLEEAQYQPEAATVSVRGLGDLRGDEIAVTHYLDTPAAVERAFDEGRGYTYYAEGLAEAFPRECGAVEAVTGWRDTLCYTLLTRQNGGLSCQNEVVFFQTDGFSRFNIRAYRRLHGRPVIPGIESDRPEDRMVLNKFVTQEEDGSLSLFLEAYATGLVKPKPTEIVLVMDQSGSMYSAMNSEDTDSYQKFTDRHQTGSGNETVPGYYAVMTKNPQVGENHESYAAALVWWDGSGWVRSKPVEIDRKDYEARKTGFTYPDSCLDAPEGLAGDNFDAPDAVYFKTVAGSAMDAMEAFLSQIQGLPGCRVAVTGFASPRYKIEKAHDDGAGLWEDDKTASESEHPRRMGGTGVYVRGELRLDGRGLSADDYANAFLGTDEDFDLLRQTVKNIKTCYWNTVTDGGFLHANEIFEAGGRADASRIVVLFTDGRPDSTSSGQGDPTDAAIAAARVTKENYGAKVYAFGPADLNLDPSAEALLKNLSSNNGGTGEYVGFAGDAESLKKLFAQLGQKIVYDNFRMGPETVLQDVISDSFTASGAVEAWSVPVVLENGGIVFEPDAANWEKLEDGISVEGRTVSVQGFDYRTNLIPTGDEAPVGAKLVVKIPIRAAEGCDGDGQDVPTNGPGSGIYDEEGRLVNRFREPTVDLSTTITVTKTVVGRDRGEAFVFEADFTQAVRYEDHDGVLVSTLEAGGNSFGGNALNAVTEDAHAAFKLKNGGAITLEQVSVGSTLTIREAENSLYRCSVKVNGVPQTLDGDALEVTVTPNMTVEFVNTSRLADLTVIKQGADDRDENQTFLFHIQGLDGDNAHISLTAAVLGNGRVTVKDLPVGRYRIAEEESWSWRYDAVSMASAGEQKDGPVIDIDLPVEGRTVTCTNRRAEDRWLDGNSHCQNIFGPNGIETTEGGRKR